MSKGLYSDPYQILQKDGDSMKTSTTVAQDLGTWQEEQALDAACCRLLANKVILAHVLQGCVPEYSRCSIPELLPCLESTPEICSVPVDQDVLDPGRIRGENTADKSITEGNVNFDILLSARTPNGRESRQIFINVESQNDWNPGYSLLKRAFYYCGRLLSRQKGIVFQNSDYQKLQKVYSIWICIKVPKAWQNTMTVFSLEPKSLVGAGKYDKMDYDMETVAVLGLGNHESSRKGILKLLSILLTPKMKPEEKREILEQEYHIPMTVEMKKEADTMCTYGQSILEEGMEKGMRQGMQKGRQEEREANVLGMLKEKIPMETISRITHYSLDQIQKLGKLHGIL